MRLITLAAVLVVSLTQDPAFTLEPIVVVGATRLTAGQVAALSGLTAGASARVADLEAAAQRLTGTGLFNTVVYRYATANGRVTATFEVAEAAWTMPVGFDNFIWLSDEELMAEVRKKVPTFDGTSPDNSAAVNYLTGVLQDVLTARGLRGSIEHRPYLNTMTRAQMHLYRVARPSPLICSMRVVGASGKWDPALREITAPMAGTEYSRNYLVEMSRASLMDVFRGQGHWSAEIGLPQATASSECDGVSVTVPVTEGPAFAWDQPEWTGTARLTPAELEKVTGLRVGDVADARNLRLALIRVGEAYGKIGHVLAVAGYRITERNTKTGRLKITIDVNEGEQYRMGTLDIVGLPASDASSLRTKWRLKPGDIYDESYAFKFWTDELVPLMKRLRVKVTAPGGRPDKELLTVNVRIAAQR